MKYLTKKGEIAMIKKLFITVLIVVATALVFHGCGGKLAGLKGAEEVVETSGKKPGMVSKNLWFEEQKDARLFLGFSDQAKDHDVALRDLWPDQRIRGTTWHPSPPQTRDSLKPYLAFSRWSQPALLPLSAPLISHR